MPSDKEYCDFILEQLGKLYDVSAKRMMGEYLLYYRGKLFGGIYDNRLLIKITKTARLMMPDAEEQLPYEGAKPMFFVENVDDSEFLAELVPQVCDELPPPKKR